MFPILKSTFLYYCLCCCNVPVKIFCLSTWPYLGPYFALSLICHLVRFYGFGYYIFLILYCLSPFPSISLRNSHQPWYLDHGGLPSNLLLASGRQHRHPTACNGVKDAKFKPLMSFYRPCSEMLLLTFSCWNKYRDKLVSLMRNGSVMCEYFTSYKFQSG